MDTFCSNRSCSHFGAELTGRERFCAACGQPVAVRRPPPLPWQVSAAVLLTATAIIIACLVAWSTGR